MTEDAIGAVIMAGVIMTVIIAVRDITEDMEDTDIIVEAKQHRGVFLFSDIKRNDVKRGRILFSYQ